MGHDTIAVGTLVLIDKGGIVRAVESGVVGETQLEDLIREAQGH